MSRFGIIISVLLSLAIAVLCSPAPSSAASSALARQKRGFRNSALSTARGFGKRMQPDDEILLEDNGILSTDWTRDMPANWSIEKLRRNPNWKKFLVQILDSNGDGKISQGEFLQGL